MTTTVETAGAVEERLDAVSGLTVFMGGVPDDAEIPRDDPDDPTSPAKPYAAVYIGGGQATSDRHGGIRPIDEDTPLDLSAPFQVTAAAGTPLGALWAVDKVRAALTGVRLFNNGQTTRLREITDPGPLRSDKAVPNDPRWYLPMQYRFTTTT
jgi:hypothetical protein